MNNFETASSMSSRNPIRPLSDNVINQIAAGEVIERPASIVKELLENSLDAGATKITVEINDGGIEHIQVRDDGHGIAPDQLRLALSRHCTSKLVDAKDLGSIVSLGFRGEALASISSVAEVSIVSRTSSQTHGWRIDSQPGATATEPRPQAHALGTTIDVRGLFATVPVRRKFLKQPRTELLHIQQFVRRAGFCYPEVAFGLVHDNKQNLSLSAPRHASSAARRWRLLFGGEFIDHAHMVDFAAADVRVHGWVGELTYSRQNAELQYIGINRRIVRDRHIAHAVRMAYDAHVDEGRHPAYALHIDMPAATVDVNVHPGKAEVRFRDPRNIHDIVYAAVKQTLGGVDRSVSTPSTYTLATGEPNINRVAESVTHVRSAPQQRTSHSASIPSFAATAENLLAIVAHKFAIAEADGLIIATDVRAAIAAIVSARFARGERDSRPLIIPETLSTELADERIEPLAAFGIELGRLGERSVALRSVPVVVSDIAPDRFGATMIARLTEGASEIDAIVDAAAAAFETPSGVIERRHWFANLNRQLSELGLTLKDFSVDLDAELLQQLFRSQSG